MDINRRKLLKFGSVAAAASLAPMPLRSLATSNSAWHDQIIEKLLRLPSKPKTLNILIPNGCQANLKPLKKILREKADIKLKQSVAPVDEINTRLLLSAGAGGESFDLALPATFGIPDVAQAGSIMSLDAMAAKHQPDNFQYDSLYTLGDHFDDKLYGYQTDGDAYVMFFNQAWIDDPENQQRYGDRFGRALTVPKTWEELDQQMAFFNEPEKGRHGGSLFRTKDYLAWEWWVRFHAKGSLPFNDEMEPQIDNDAGIKALEDLIAASRSQCESSRTNGLFENWKEFSQGNCYANIGWGGTQKYLNSPSSLIKGKLSYSPMPGGVIRGKTVRIPYFNWGWNYTVPSSARSAEAGYLTALLATTPEISTQSVRQNGFFDPFRTSHYEDEVIQDMYSSAFLEAHKESMMTSIPDLYVLGTSSYMAALKNYLHRADIGDVTPKQALQAVAKTWKGLNYRYGVETQALHWKRVKARYPAHLRDLLA